MAVIFLAGFGIFKTNHGSHSVIALHVGVVEAFDVGGEFFHPQVFFHGGQDAFAVPFGIYQLTLLAFFYHVIFGVAFRKLHQMPFVADFRNGKRDAGQLQVESKRQQHLGGRAVEALSEIGHCQGE